MIKYLADIYVIKYLVNIGMVKYLVNIFAIKYLVDKRDAFLSPTINQQQHLLEVHLAFIPTVTQRM